MLHAGDQLPRLPHKMQNKVDKKKEREKTTQAVKNHSPH
jgi:hypothetical protein